VRLPNKQIRIPNSASQIAEVIEQFDIGLAQHPRVKFNGREETMLARIARRFGLS
jgi:hypothetical protein